MRIPEILDCLRTDLELNYSHTIIFKHLHDKVVFFWVFFWLGAGGGVCFAFCCCCLFFLVWFFFHSSCASGSKEISGRSTNEKDKS